VNRDLAILGTEKSLRNARTLLEDSRALFSRKRYGTAYALAIFALEETAKGFVFHWVADGVLTEPDLRKLIYNHRSKHAIIQLTDFFEKATSIFVPKMKTLFEGDLELTLEPTEAVRMIKTAFRQSSQDHVHLLIHAQQRREISLYVGICPKCDRELLGPWLINASDVNELIDYVERHLVNIEYFVRNCKRHESGIVMEETAPLRPLVKRSVESLQKAAKVECQHDLCSRIKLLPRKS
jgi:AbiV family abortive infection protein